jgi:hypothetical protein
MLLRAHRRKDRRVEVAVGGGEYPCAGAVLFGGDLEFKHWDDCKREHKVTCREQSSIQAREI